jgi:penicillin-binding protein 1B
VKKKPARSRAAARGRRRWLLYLFVASSIVLVVGSALLGYYYVTFSKVIDARLNGALQRSDPRIFARPFTIRRGQRITLVEMIDRLNDLGYAQRPRAERPGEFTIGRDALVMIPRSGDQQGHVVRFAFAPPRGKRPAGNLTSIELPLKHRSLGGVELDAPLLTALVTEGREKRRDVPITAIPQRMIQAVLAIEDRRFYDHPGIDLIGTTRAVITNLFGSRRYLSGGSTLTQQLVRNTFISSMWGLERAQEKSARRKVTEWLMAVALERRLTKDQILQLYLNDVYLGQRGSFAIHGVPEAARLFFAKDISNVSLTEAATIAGVIQAPPRYSPFTNKDRARERRNVVLHAMADAGYISPEAAERASHEPLQAVDRALESEAPYFVDFASQEIENRVKMAGAVDVYTTLDLHLQRIAQEAVRSGLDKVDAILSRRRRVTAQAALIAIDPRTGEILAMVGGRSYNQSQYNRAVNARRQPGSVFKPFVYLAAFEHAKEEGRTDVTPATIVVDEPTSFTFNEQTWTPQNYENEYDGPITLRRALAMSRNIATIKVAESTGYDTVAALWKRIGAGTPPRPYPSIALGVFEATPYEIATAYTLFPNFGTLRPLRAIERVVDNGKPVPIDAPAPRTVTSRDTTFLVTNMMRSVMNEGTGAAARANGFVLDAAGKSGTTNDYRDAWFVGFTPELLTAVWVGLDDNQVLGMSGSRAALPIWTEFMARALAGHQNVSFEPPDGVVFVDIDRDTGMLATPTCPRVITESFLVGTEPTQLCTVHQW